MEYFELKIQKKMKEFPIFDYKIDFLLWFLEFQFWVKI